MRTEPGFINIAVTPDQLKLIGYVMEMELHRSQNSYTAKAEKIESEGFDEYDLDDAEALAKWIDDIERLSLLIDAEIHARFMR